MRTTGWLRGLMAAATALVLAASTAPAGAAPEPFTGRPAVAKPLGPSPFPAHPFMSNAGANSMHGDGYASDTHPFSGPLGRSPEVVRATLRFASTS